MGSNPLSPKELPRGGSQKKPYTPPAFRMEKVSPSSYEKQILKCKQDGRRKPANQWESGDQVWQDADPDIHVLRQAKAEFGKLQ